MCGRARYTERKTELDKEKERGEEKRGTTKGRERTSKQGRGKNNENSAPFRHNAQVLICCSVVSTQNAGRGIKQKLLMDAWEHAEPVNNVML